MVPSILAGLRNKRVERLDMVAEGSGILEPGENSFVALIEVVFRSADPKPGNDLLDQLPLLSGMIK